VVSNRVMEHFEETALDTADYKPANSSGTSKALSRYGHIDQQSYSNFSTVSTMLDLPLEIESNNTLPFLDVLLMKRVPNLPTKVYGKPTHSGRYLHFKSKHPHHVKRGVARSLANQAKVNVKTRKLTSTLKT
jgi:hypothetical protein